ncbi:MULTISPECIES: DUF2812 domain-containing protein [unclassified Clostridioides]|uniref:DUF2812 domain-containing protein n=1 Tax=unclassified Clostridioides TaxID=2635829 RepID=UPI001D108FE5|nr:DUF2812 domain-containing protein [Clostridioides sp. ZZV14-6150]MCC0666611.1 DUF2812 domain-containing protein [Clostridioides sp. ZZV14-6153]MCC0722797.1 DUF2812 domain-containing protein [Clostridioides sp. ZZV14-6104]MCC0725329.1 DUF2812 domain-containing protein [Clostridioides sp. ZZV14-6045]MCC0734176.1 DUF2812 domain-containing protein [Clostridioides sp. ZZV14-6009]MCC0737497.1 DUF2812 domain-containing protein [Clostridioides sp. ZZV14-5902]MCC0742416.1 DUF2812 domain-containing 
MEKKMKFKFDWYSSPDRIEEWLEDMEEQGYNLYKISKLGGIFYFYKGTPRKIKYAIDYYYDAEEDYFNKYKSRGWNLIFRSIGSFIGTSSWYVWTKTYEDVPPKLYSGLDNKDKVKSILFMNLFLFTILVVIFIYLLFTEIRNLFNGYGVDICTIALQIMLLTLYLVQLYRRIMYYLRIKKLNK